MKEANPASTFLRVAASRALQIIAGAFLLCVILAAERSGFGFGVAEFVLKTTRVVVAPVEQLIGL